MKELWLEIEASVPETQKTKLLKSAAKTCDGVLVDTEDVEKTKKAGVKTASTSQEADIVVLSALDPEKLKLLKAEGITTAIKIIITGKKDEKTAIEAAKNRCKTITRIQNRLYTSPSFAKIDMAETIKILVRFSYSIYQDGIKNIRIRREIKNIYMDLNQAFYCALLINEFLSNSLRHAFKNDATGEIEIIIQETDQGHVLTFRDNGAGVPESIDTQYPKTFGLQLILELIKRLDGIMSVPKGEGTEFIVTF